MKHSKKLELYRFLLSVAIEYAMGYEFPELHNGEWKRGAQWKLDYFISAIGET